jgi:signal transduction histidine kinase
MFGRGLFLLRLLLACLMPAWAYGAAPAPIDLHHMSWTARDGAPTMVITMTQTRDGWLWLGGVHGLYRFDGSRFERYAGPGQALPAASISILNAFDDGALWIGYRYGGASVLSQGRLRNYNERNGLPASAPVWGLERDGAGRMWAATAEGLFYLDGERWLAAAPAFGVPAAPYKTLMRDREGNLWAQGDQGVYTLRQGAARFVKTSPDIGTGVLFQVPDGSVWSWNAPRNDLRRLAGNGDSPWSVHGNVASMLFDSRGDLWVGRLDSVEYQTRQQVRQSGRADGLSGRWVAAMFEDREGSVWTATATGIDRFRRKRIASVALPAVSDINPLAAGANGAVWVGRYHLAPQSGAGFATTTLWPRTELGWDDDLICNYADPHGVLWISGYARLWRISGMQRRELPLPGWRENAMITSMSSDEQGDLWVSVVPRGLYRRDAQGAWHDMRPATGLAGETPRMLASSAEQGLWLGYPRSRVLQLQRGQWRRYGPADGLNIGMVESLHLKGAHVWVGGENGVALRQGARFVPVGGAGGVNFEGVSGMVELDNGDLWLNGGAGLYRIAAAEIARLEATPGYRVRYERLDSVDGLAGNAPVRYPVPSMILASDGYLWLTTTAGVFRLDPALREPAHPAVPVLIRGIGPPGQVRQAQSAMRLPAGTTALQLDYTALALAMPERVAFRYRLDGVDSEWQQVGARRAAYYNNLGPGEYRFSVAATNYHGDWSEQASTLEFSIAPTVMQSWWFRAGCALLALAACWLLYRWRLHDYALRVAARLEERLKERERIARELHDTLLQSVQGMILHVHAAALRLPPPEPARVLIEQALQQADDTLAEGRERVRDLRANDQQEQDLATAIGMAAWRMRGVDGVAPQIVVSGALRKLHPLVYEEVLAIACEALANTYRHAMASRIEVLLHYGRRELQMVVSDNGTGIPAEVIAAGGRDNHWGICGMHERAERIKARLLLDSHPDGGTVWRLTLAGSLAYLPPARRPWFGRSAT